MALSIGICGGGIGGFCAAIALHKLGHDVRIFEQAPVMARVGADINLLPNAILAMDRLGVGDDLRAAGAQPTFRISRDGESGEETSRIPMKGIAEAKYGAPQLTLHRADVLEALHRQLPSGALCMGVEVTGVSLQGDASTVQFANRASESFDLVIGADGIHSAVRSSLWGADTPKYTGMVSYRGTFPTSAVPGLPDTDAFTKWWGEIPEKQIVTFPLSQGREVFVFATLPQKDGSEEGWTLPGDAADLRRAYANFHPNARALLEPLDKVMRSALHVRDPMPEWAKGRATLLGDAAHPMVPFMAQGACMAIEDAIVLARALEGVGKAGVDDALYRYESERKPRTARIQENSLANDWLKKSGNADWVYGYDAWTVPLNEETKIRETT